MSKRIQVIVDEEELERFRRLAATRGMSLSAWLREAGREKQEAEARPRIESVEELDAFFAACDEGRSGREPEWEEHLAVIRRSRAEGL